MTLFRDVRFPDSFPGNVTRSRRTVTLGLTPLKAHWGLFLVYCSPACKVVRLLWTNRPWPSPAHSMVEIEHTNPRGRMKRFWVDQKQATLALKNTSIKYHVCVPNCSGQVYMKCVSGFTSLGCKAEVNTLVARSTYLLCCLLWLHLLCVSRWKSQCIDPLECAPHHS